LSKREELKSKIRLLQEFFGDKYPIGIESFGYWNDYFDPFLFSIAKKNVEELMPKSMALSIHAPFSVKPHSIHDFFAFPQGFSSLKKLLDFSDELGADLINFHVSPLVTYGELKDLSEYKRVQDHKEKTIRSVRSRLERAQALPCRKVLKKICVENVLYTFSHDRELDPEKMVYTIIDFSDPRDLMQVINPARNIYATIDVCHLACVCDSSQLLKKIKLLGNGLGHVHFSDAGQVWKPFMSLGAEGLIPGQGRIGEKVGKELLAYFLEISREQDLSIVFEIKDNDYLKLEESREGFKVIRKWLDELDK